MKMKEIIVEHMALGKQWTWMLRIVTAIPNFRSWPSNLQSQCERESRIFRVSFLSTRFFKINLVCYENK